MGLGLGAWLGLGIGVTVGAGITVGVRVRVRAQPGMSRSPREIRSVPLWLTCRPAHEYSTTTGAKLEAAEAPRTW